MAKATLTKLHCLNCGEQKVYKTDVFNYEKGHTHVCGICEQMFESWGYTSTIEEYYCADRETLEYSILAIRSMP